MIKIPQEEEDVEFQLRVKIRDEAEHFLFSESENLVSRYTDEFGQNYNGLVHLIDLSSVDGDTQNNIVYTIDISVFIRTKIIFDIMVLKNCNLKLTTTN